MSFTDLHKSRHCSYLTMAAEWKKWRLCYEAGDAFLDKYLYCIDQEREDKKDFQKRKCLSPVPSFARSAINEVRNSVFQHMGGILRTDGSLQYTQAVNGERGGVDKRHTSMNAFMGCDALEELLVMGKVGIYVDMPQLPPGTTMADIATSGVRPYLYMYPIEDILNFTMSMPNEESKYQAVLLRDQVVHYDQLTALPLSTTERLRAVWINPETKKVNVLFFDEDGNSMDIDGNATEEPTELNLTQIPFVMMDIGNGLMSDISQHQISMLNISSRMVDYTLKSCYTTYVEQGDNSQVGAHYQTLDEDGNEVEAADEVTQGNRIGRRYPMGANQPNFIAPPASPATTAKEVNACLEGEIRKLINLAVTKLAARESAAAKAFDNNGLEAGLSFIGLVMEKAEKEIAIHWAQYEGEGARAATVAYPDRWRLTSSREIIEEATKLEELIQKVPSKKLRKTLWKNVVAMLMQGKATAEEIEAIKDEIEAAKFTTGDLNTILEAKRNGLAGAEVCSDALGFDGKTQVPIAQEEEAERLAFVAATQTSGLADAGKRDVDDPNATPEPEDE